MTFRRASRAEESGARVGRADRDTDGGDAVERVARLHGRSTGGRPLPECAPRGPRRLDDGRGDERRDRGEDGQPDRRPSRHR